MRVLALILCLIATPALAWTSVPVVPPASVDHPYANPGKLTVGAFDYWTVRELCRKSIDIQGSGYAEACTMAMPDGGCNMVLPKLSPQPSAQEIDWYVALIRQETAECNDEAYAREWLGA